MLLSNIGRYASAVCRFSWARKTSLKCEETPRWSSCWWIKFISRDFCIFQRKAKVPRVSKRRRKHQKNGPFKGGVWRSRDESTRIVYHNAGVKKNKDTSSNTAVLIRAIAVVLVVAPVLILVLDSCSCLLLSLSILSIVYLALKLWSWVTTCYSWQAPSHCCCWCDHNQSHRWLSSSHSHDVHGRVHGCVHRGRVHHGPHHGPHRGHVRCAHGYDHHGYDHVLHGYDHCIHCIHRHCCHHGGAPSRSRTRNSLRPQCHQKWPL